MPSSQSTILVEVPSISPSSKSKTPSSKSSRQTEIPILVEKTLISFSSDTSSLSSRKNKASISPQTEWPSNESEKPPKKRKSNSPQPFKQKSISPLSPPTPPALNTLTPNCPARNSKNSLTHSFVRPRA